MKTISIVGSAKIILPNNDSEGNCALFQLLEKDGYCLTENPSGDYLVAINHNKKMYDEFIKSGGRPEQTILLRLEPPSVFPAQYKKSLVNKYGLIISPGMSGMQYPVNQYIGWPYQYHLNPNLPKESDPSLDSVMQSPERPKIFQVESWKNRSITLSMIAANKVGPAREGNYSLRRKAAIRIPRDTLQVYGPLWNDVLVTKIHHRLAVSVFSLRQGTFPDPKSIYGNLFRAYPNALGVVLNKHEILRKSKFSLVFENSNSTISEKLFDALINGVIPIYVGPSLKEVGLPTDLAIISSGDPEEIMEIIRVFDLNRVESILNAIQKFLDSTLFWDNWTAGPVYRKVQAEIVAHIERLER